MARATIHNIEYLRKAAKNLEESSDYQWGHMGSCNCGFLAQEITRLSKSEIHRRAMQRHGDWNEQLNDYCQTSGYPMDDIIRDLTSTGFSIEDLKSLERLSDPLVLRKVGKTHLEKNLKKNVVLYLKKWAELLEEQLAQHITLPKESNTKPLAAKVIQ